MLFQLRPHPQSEAVAAHRISVSVTRLAGDLLTLSYRLYGNIAALQFPSPAAPAQADRLWERTCFEAFLQAHGEDGYLEFNFSPSSEWAAYRLSGYRSGMTSAEVEPPVVEARAEADLYELRATIRWAGGGRLGLSAIVEDHEGRKSWWAVEHPPGEPDFHHPACFALELPPAERP